MFQAIHNVTTRLLTQPAIASLLFPLARISLALVFVVAGFNKLGDGYDGTVQYMASMGVPGYLLPLVIALEIGGGLALMAGWQTRATAVLLAVFSLTTGYIFHSAIDDPMQKILLLKNISIAGGLLILSLTGAGRLSVDRTLYHDDV